MGIWTTVIDKANKWVLSVVGVFTAAIGIYLYGRQQGSLREAQKAAEKDRDNARKIEDAADRARRADGGNLSPVERLSKYSRIRDATDDM